jgi:hypothetical protein
MQNHVDPTAIETVAFCKRRLATFTFNCGAQQTNYVIFFKTSCPGQKNFYGLSWTASSYGLRN